MSDIDDVIIHYYEASVLCCPSASRPTSPTLDDYHQAAWRLFAGNTHYAPEMRPFLFCFEPLTAEQHLLVLRSAVEFPHAQPKQKVMRRGEVIPLEWYWVPSVATRLSPTGERLTRSKHIPAPRERWETLLSERLLKHGFVVDPKDICCTPLGQWPMSEQQDLWYPRVLVRAALRVNDAQQAAHAWLSGVSRLKAYGMGMLCQVA